MTTQQTEFLDKKYHKLRFKLDHKTNSEVVNNEKLDFLTQLANERFTRIEFYEPGEKFKLCFLSERPKPFLKTLDDLGLANISKRIKELYKGIRESTDKKSFIELLTYFGLFTIDEVTIESDDACFGRDYFFLENEQTNSIPAKTIPLLGFYKNLTPKDMLLSRKVALLSNNIRKAQKTTLSKYSIDEINETVFFHEAGHATFDVEYFRNKKYEDEFMEKTIRERQANFCASYNGYHVDRIILELSYIQPDIYKNPLLHSDRFSCIDYDKRYYKMINGEFYD